MKTNPETFSAWPEEKKKLHDLVMTAPGEFVIEIGCYQGATSRILADACGIRRKQLVCIDPWDGEQDESGSLVFAEFLKTMRDYHPVIHVKKSADVDAEALLGECALVFIDGLHSYEGVRDDIAKFSPCCAPGGWMAAHDYRDDGWPGVRKAVDEHVAANRLTLHALTYFPTPEEIVRYGHGVSGLAYFQPNP